MSDTHILKLTFPSMTYGLGEVPLDLRRWIYKGGASANARTVAAKIEANIFGPPLAKRIELVRQIHKALSNRFEYGGSRQTLIAQIEKVKMLFCWADETGFVLSLESIEEGYRNWTDSLLHRARIANDLSQKVAYDYGNVVGWVLDQVLDRKSPLIKTTRLRRPKRINRAVSAQADKQNLEETFALGHLLLEISDVLGVDVIWGPLPVHIQLRNGKELVEWSGPKRSPRKPPHPKYLPQARWYAKRSAEHHARWQDDTTFRTRYPLINLRIQAEMFMLLGQSAVNLAQIHQLRMDQWRYKPSTQGYEIRTYKHRKWGAVVFEIYSEYRTVFERYLKWRAAIFPDDPDGLLFPLLGKGGKPTARHPEKAPSFDRIKSVCLRAGVAYMHPRSLRSTNVNWMLRRTENPNLTAAEKQHSTETLLQVYEKPSLQRAMVQIKKFWGKHDPAQVAAGPGTCLSKSPEPVEGKPTEATEPDCLTPAGCLFCIHQRDIDNFDHIWSLISFRLLKSFELRAQVGHASKRDLPPQPAEAAIEQITAKLNHIAESSPKRSAWVREASMRLEEGRYHPSWAEIIESSY